MEGTTATQAAGKRAIDALTVAEAFRITAEQKPDQVALRNRDDSVSITWGEVRDRSDALAGGLAKLGVGKGDTVALMFGNRPEFHISDLAAMTLGAVPFSIYQTYTPEQIEYLIADSGARVAILEQAFLDRFLEARKQLPELEHVIVVDGEAPEGVMALADVEGSNADFDAEAAWRAIKPEDLLTLIYTSGTTGPPKGVQLSHANQMDVVASIEEIIGLPEGIRVISWLPSAHIAERGAHHYLPIVYGMTVTSCPNPREIIAVLPEVRPNWFFAVPRIWEKLKAGLEAMIESLPDDQRIPTEQGIAAAIEVVRLEQRGEPVPDELAATLAAADEQIFSRLRHQLGLDEVAAINVGAAPTPVPVLEFFHAIGLELSELWGMSETCGAGSVNPQSRMKLGTVGTAGPGVELKLARDGELLMRSDVSWSATATCPRRRPRRSTPTAGCTPATSRRSTTRATSASSTARRNSSSMRRARTCRRPTSRACCGSAARCWAARA